MKLCLQIVSSTLKSSAFELPLIFLDCNTILQEELQYVGIVVQEFLNL